MLSLSTLTIMADTVEASHQHRKTPHHREPTYVVPAYSLEDMAEITSYLKKCNFDSDKMEAAKLIVKLRPITVNGLDMIARMFSFDDKRAEFLIFAYDYCADKDFYFKLKDTFSFRSSADKMCKDLGIK